MKKRILFSIAAAILFAACNTSSADDKLKKEISITSSTYEVTGGWAYRILVDKKIFIQQDFIPAISGHKAFPSKESAENIASVVIEKMRLHEKPFITPQELQKAGAIAKE